MTADASLSRKSACELTALIASRAVSPIEVLDAHLAVIERVNPRLNAFVTLAADAARRQAHAVEASLTRGDQLGPLAGLPIGVKDITPTAGIRTTYGSSLYKDHVPEEDGEVVARLKAAGAIVLGKTNTPEFAAGAHTVNAVFGATRNPWNPALSPAGSSGGSAAAVASGMVPLAQGTDFGGSVRVPAAFCGIVGLRATPGLTPNYPAALAWDYGQVHGPLARSVEDAALMFDAMVGLSRRSPISVPPRGRARWQRFSAARMCAVCASPTRRISPASVSIPRSTRSAARQRAGWSRRVPRSRRSPSTPPTAAIPIRPGVAPGWSGGSSRDSHASRNSAPI